jgi:hypothetical protein
MSEKNKEHFSPEETNRRMAAALRGARIAGHKTMKDIPKKNGESRGSKRKCQPKGQGGK